MLLNVSVHLTSNMIPLVNYFQIAFIFAYEATYNYYQPLFFIHYHNGLHQRLLNYFEPINLLKLSLYWY